MFLFRKKIYLTERQKDVLYAIKETKKYEERGKDTIIQDWKATLYPSHVHDRKKRNHSSKIYS